MLARFGAALSSTFSACSFSNLPSTLYATTISDFNCPFSRHSSRTFIYFIRKLTGGLTNEHAFLNALIQRRDVTLGHLSTLPRPAAPELHEGRQTGEKKVLRRGPWESTKESHGSKQFLIIHPLRFSAAFTPGRSRRTPSIPRRALRRGCVFIHTPKTHPIILSLPLSPPTLPLSPYSVLF